MVSLSFPFLRCFLDWFRSSFILACLPTSFTLTVLHFPGGEATRVLRSIGASMPIIGLCLRVSVSFCLPLDSVALFALCRTISSSFLLPVSLSLLRSDYLPFALSLSACLSVCCFRIVRQNHLQTFLADGLDSLLTSIPIRLFAFLRSCCVHLLCVSSSINSSLQESLRTLFRKTSRTFLRMAWMRS